MTDRVLYRGVQAFITFLNICILLPGILWQSGLTTVADKLYTFLGLFCHQMPERSFFINGPQFMYSKSELLSVTTPNRLFSLNPAERFTCADSIGCKFGVCSRCTGLYTGMFTGMVLSPYIEKVHFKKWLLLILLLPMAIDGIIQFIASVITPDMPFYISNNRLRFVTGFAFGFGFSSYAFMVLRRELAKTAMMDNLQQK